MAKYFDISHPGEHLQEDFLKPLNLTGYKLAKAIGVPRQSIYDVLAGKRAITAELSLLLDRYFGMSEGFFHRLQAGYDRINARRRLQNRLAEIQPLTRENQPLHL